MKPDSTNFFRQLLLAAALLALLPPTATAQNEDEPEAFLISINSDEGQIQGMAMSMASTLAEQGKDVRVLLCGPAGELALEENIPPALRPREVSPKEMMLEAMSLGAAVQVCELFLPNSGFRQYEESDLVQDVSQARAEEIAEFMLRPNVRTFSY